MKLWHKVALGLVLGVLVGHYFPIFGTHFKVVGDLFLKMIKFIIGPLIFFSLITGLTSSSEKGALGRASAKALFGFACTTIFAILFGITMGLICQPGVGVSLVASGHDGVVIAAKTSFSFIEFCVGIVPSDFVRPFMDNNVLQIVFIAIFIGICMNNLGQPVSMVKDFVHSVNKIISKMIFVIIELSPYGAFSLTAHTIGTQGIAIIFGLSKLVIVITFAMAIQYIVFGILIKIFGKISPMPFYKKSLEYQAIAFATSSSKATLSTTIQVCKDKMGISETSSLFILPLGAAINMVGLAINLSLTSIFFAQVYNVDLTLVDYLIVVIMSTIGSIGGAGIPGASLFMLPMVLSSIGVPIEGVALLAGVDRFLDMLRTTINITGDVTVTLIVDASEGKLNKGVYYKNDNV